MFGYQDLSVTIRREVRSGSGQHLTTACGNAQVDEVAVNSCSTNAEQLADFGRGLVLLQIERFGQGLRIKTKTL